MYPVYLTALFGDYFVIFVCPLDGVLRYFPCIYIRLFEIFNAGCIYMVCCGPHVSWAADLTSSSFNVSIFHLVVNPSSADFIWSVTFLHLHVYFSTLGVLIWLIFYFCIVGTLTTLWSLLSWSFKFLFLVWRLTFNIVIFYFCLLSGELLYAFLNYLSFKTPLEYHFINCL